MLVGHRPVQGGKPILVCTWAFRAVSGHPPNTIVPHPSKMSEASASDGAGDVRCALCVVAAACYASAQTQSVRASRRLATTAASAEGSRPPSRCSTGAPSRRSWRTSRRSSLERNVRAESEQRGRRNRRSWRRSCSCLQVLQTTCHPQVSINRRPNLVHRCHACTHLLVSPPRSRIGRQLFQLMNDHLLSASNPSSKADANALLELLSSSFCRHAAHSHVTRAAHHAFHTAITIRRYERYSLTVPNQLQHVETMRLPRENLYHALVYWAEQLATKRGAPAVEPRCSSCRRRAVTATSAARRHAATAPAPVSTCSCGALCIADA